MNKRFTYLLPVFMIIVVSGCSSTHQMNPTPEQQNSSHISGAEADFNQERLIKEAYAKGLSEGIVKGHDQAVNIITKEYLPYIKRLEAGKYAIKKGFITPPEIMIIQSDDGVLSYRASGCKIEKELDVNDIFKRFGGLVEGKSISASQEKDEDALNDNSGSYYTPSRDNIKKMPMRAGYQAEEMTKIIDKTATNKIVLDEYNVRYTERDGAYNATFASKEEMQGFCGQFRICSKD